MVWLLAVVVACGAACGGAPASGPAVVTVPIASGSATPPPAIVDAPLVAKDDAAWSDAESPVPVTSKDPLTGRRDALVTLVVFSDFQCPYCAKSTVTLKALREAYGPDALRVVWKNHPLPFHKDAHAAAEAAQGVFAASGSEAFWKFHDLAFSHPQELTRANFIRWAVDAGVPDARAYEAGLDDQLWAGKVDADAAIATALGANGTPSFFINGVLLSGAQPFDKFKELVDAELAKAQSLVRGGTTRARVYVAASSENRKNLPAPRDDDDDDAKDDTKTVWKLPAGNAPARGPKTALVTIVEFSDFQCPYCARVAPTIAALEAKYGHDLRVLWRNEPLPFHPRAEPAAELAFEARAEKGDAGFWAAHDMLFANQRALDDADLEGYAVKLGLDLARVKSAIATHKYKAQIDDDLELADDFQASGTPHFFINGRRLVGAQPKDKFEKIIDEELVKARALVHAGTAASNVYDAMIKGGKGPPPLERKTVPPAANAPSKGPANAKVTIQEFADFQCPFCARAETIVAEVLKNYGGRVRFVWRNLPLPMHPDAPLAAQAGVEAYKQRGAAAFWKIHDEMLKSPSDLKRPRLDGYAAQLGLDMTKWNAALDHGTHRASVDAETGVANTAGITGTPAFLINGYFLSGAQPYAKFRKVIERALAEAKP